MISDLFEKITYRGLIFLARQIGNLQPEKGAYLGRQIGRFLFRCHRRYRNIALNNLKNGFPQKTDMERTRIAKQVFENLGKIFYEVCWSSTMTEYALREKISSEGVAHMNAAYARGRGVLVLTAHFGNWELLTALGKELGYPLSIVYRPLDFKPLERFIVMLRTRFGAEMIPKKKGMRNVLRSIAEKKIVAILMDQNVAWREGVFAPFMGMPACTNKGLALLALKTKAPVIPVFLLRTADGYRGIIQPAIPLIETGDKTKDIEANTAAYNLTIEKMVRQYPDQWFWVHRRWNTKPYCPWPRKSS